jgi:hypothetical protein
MLANFGLEKYIGTEVADIISGGMLDWVIDTSFQTILSDPDFDMAWGDFLAPGANIINTGRAFIEWGFQEPVKTMAGPSGGGTLGRLGEAYKYSRDIIRLEDDRSSVEKGFLVAEQVTKGLASGYNDYYKAKLMQATGRHVSGNGRLQALEATWSDVIAKGFLGVTSEASLNAWLLRQSSEEKEQALNEIAKEYYDRIQGLTLAWHGGTKTKEAYLDTVRQQKAMLQYALDPEEWAYVAEEFNRLDSANKEEYDSVALKISEALTKGIPVDEDTLSRINKLPIPQEDKDAIIQQVESQSWKTQYMEEQAIDNLDEQERLIEQYIND